MSDLGKSNKFDNTSPSSAKLDFGNAPLNSFNA